MFQPLHPKKYGLEGRPSYDQIIKYVSLVNLKEPNVEIDRRATRILNSLQIKDLFEGSDGVFGHKQAQEVFNKQMENQEIQNRIMNAGRVEGSTVTHLKETISRLGRPEPPKGPDMFDIGLEAGHSKRYHSLDEAIKEEQHKKTQ